MRVFLRLANPTKPIRPEPNNHTAAGTGTTVLDAVQPLVGIKGTLDCHVPLTISLLERANSAKYCPTIIPFVGGTSSKPSN